MDACLCYFKMTGRNWPEREVKGGLLWASGKTQDKYHESSEGGHDERSAEGETVHGESLCTTENSNG